MTIREITALRKSGQLEDALQAAEAEFSKDVNKYTVGALFWCLNDLYKTQPHDEAVDTIERMKLLYDDYGNGDEYIKKSLAAAERAMMPHYEDVKEAVKEAKCGVGAASSYARIANLYEKGELGTSSFGDFGWLIYYALKSTSPSDTHGRKAMLDNYLKLELPKPSVLHSLILLEAIKTGQDMQSHFSICGFVALWGMENFREEDWEQYRTDDGNVLPSLIEKLVGACTKEVKCGNAQASDALSDLVDKVLEKYPANQNMPYYKATILLSQGRKAEAASYYRDLILRFPTKYYLWFQLAAIIDDVDTKVGLLGKALTLDCDEQFLGAVRLMMAQMLIAKGERPAAKYELEKYAAVYESMGWSLNKVGYKALCSQLEGVEASKSNDVVYAKYSSKAEEFIYGQLKEHVAVKVSERMVEDKNHPGRKFVLWLLRTKDGTFRLKKPYKLGLDCRTKNGAVFGVRVHDGKIVWIKPLEGTPAVDWLKRVKGEVKPRTDRNGKRFAIVDGAYVGEKLLESATENQYVEVVVVKQDDGRWAAVSLKKMDL